PICGIWPVKNGSTSPAAINSAASARFCTCALRFSVFIKKYSFRGTPAGQARAAQTFCTGILPHNSPQGKRPNAPPCSNLWFLPRRFRGRAGQEIGQVDGGAAAHLAAESAVILARAERLQ